MFFKFPKIDSFHSVYRNTKKYLEDKPIKNHFISYRGKVKLHGTNAGVVIEPKSRANPRILAQSRTRTLSVGSDNYGFAAWVARNKDFFEILQNSLEVTSVWEPLDRDYNPYITVFGEWCGPGINSGTAISEIDKKVFVVFSIFAYDVWHEGHYIYEPSELEDLLPPHDEIFILPWHTPDWLHVDFMSPGRAEVLVEACTQEVLAVEACDPWVEKTFNIKGTGEGLVYYPYNEDEFTRYLFKAKGEKHKVVKTKKVISVDPENMKTLEGLVDSTLTEARFEQALSEGVGGILDKKQIGPFIGWLARDITKDIESGEIVLPPGVHWKSGPHKLVTQKAKDWYLERIEKCA